MAPPPSSASINKTEINLINFEKPKYAIFYSEL